MQLQSRSVSLLFSVLFLFLTGCAAMGPGVEKPTITVIDIRPGEIRAMEAIFVLELRIMNPNDFALDIRGLNCELSLDDNRFASGISDVQQQVPAFGTATLPVTVYASMFEIATSAVQIFQQLEGQGAAASPLAYQLAGKVRLAGHGSVAFESRGELDLGRSSGGSQ